MRKRPRVVAGVILGAMAMLWLATPKNAQTPDDPENESVRSWPPDTTLYVRPAVPQDHAPGGRMAIAPSVALAPVFPDVFIADVVVSNTDPDLTNRDRFGDTEPSIAVNPDNTDEIVLTAFSGSWGSGVAPLWHTTNAGDIWAKEFTIPIPPGVPSAPGCPCDQAVDYGRGNGMSGTFLSGGNVYSGITTDPANTLAWNWLVVDGVTQRTNSARIGGADQPWLLVNADPTIPAQDDVYVAYDDFSGAPNMRVAASPGTSPTSPPNFTIDNLAGFSTGSVNPGQRLAIDHNSGAVYTLFQRVVRVNPDGSKNINYMLNRSVDGGLTWGLNGSPTGIVVANGDSTQPTPKFGTVNALLGGVDHAAVDPTTRDVYVVYGNRDADTGNNRLSIVRLTDDGMGGLNIGPSFFVTCQVQAALPSVAVTNDSYGTVGVLYDTFDGIDPDSGFPIFSAHLAVSQDRGTTFTDVVLETFLSPAKDNGNARQRVLGDYQQLKAVGSTFYGVFTGNGVPFGRPFSNTDPIFFRTDAR